MRTNSLVLVLSPLLLSSFILASGCAPVLTQQLRKPIQIAAGRSPMYGSSADLNADGKLDLVVTRSWGRGEVMVLLGNGDGTFAEPLRIAGNGSPKSPCITDLNGDGKPDLAITDLVEGGNVSVLLGNGNGSFAEPTSHLIGRTAASMKAGDFNGDGKVDLLTVTTRPESNLMAEEVAGKIIFLAGHGDGSFDAPRMMNFPGTPLSLAVGDWDSDGKLDVMIPEETRREIHFLRGNGDGSFSPTSRAHSRFDPLGVAPPADFNKDGKLDLLVGVIGGQSLYLGEGGGSFRHDSDIYTEATRSGFTGDFDKDGRLDIVTARRLLHGNGRGQFVLESLPHRAYNDAMVTAGDFNGDGWLDVVTIDSLHNEIEVFLNRGSSKTAVEPTASR